MRKIILDLAISLDGFIEGPNGEIDWLIGDEDVDFGDIINDILVGIDAIFYGRISYDLWGNYQPDENSSAKLKEAYKSLHSKQKYVFSATKRYENGVTTIDSNIKENVEQILQEPGENIWLYGGGKLTTTFINLGLIDVYRLAVHPVILGAGKPLFQNIKQRVGLKLVDITKSSGGVVLLNYEANR
jgi:dihydrofolate reductase